MSSICDMKPSIRSLVNVLVNGQNRARDIAANLIHNTRFTEKELKKDGLFQYLLTVKESHPDLEYFILSIFLQMSALDSYNTNMLCDLTCSYIDSLSDKDKHIQYLVTNIIGNIAGEGQPWSDILVEKGAIGALSEIDSLSELDKQKFSTTTWSIINLFKYSNTISKSQIREALGYFSRILRNEEPRGLCDIFCTVSFISKMDIVEWQEIVQWFDFQMVVETISKKNVEAVRQALFFCGHVVCYTSNASHTFIEYQILEHMKQGVDNSKTILADVFYCLSNMVCDDHAVQEEILKTDFVCQALTEYPLVSQNCKDQIVWFLINLCDKVETKRLKTLERKDIFRFFIHYTQQTVSVDEKLQECLDKVLRRFSTVIPESRSEYEDIFLELYPPLPL